MTKYDEAVKRRVVQEYLDGRGGFRHVSQKHGIGYSVLRRWVGAFRQHGEAGLRKKHETYSAEFKMSVLQHMWRHELSYQHTCAVFDLREANIRPKKYRSYRGEPGRVAPNLPKRQFEASKPNEKWVTDVTEFNVGGKKLYLSPVLDLYNGEIIAWESSERPDFALIRGMLDKAFRRLLRGQTPMLHSDQGWAYQMRAYRERLAKRGLVQSMSRKGNCLDNAAMESFFGTLKSECFRLARIDCVEQLRRAIANYIHYYNHERIKLKLKGLSPVQYRTQPLAA